MSKDLSIYLSICLSVYLSVYLSIHLSKNVSIYLSIYLASYLSSSYLLIYLYIYIFIHLSIYLSVCLSVCLSVFLCIYVCIYLSIYLPIYLCIYVYVGGSLCKGFVIYAQHTICIYLYIYILWNWISVRRLCFTKIFENSKYHSSIKYIYIYAKNEEIQHSSKLTAENHAIFSVPSPCTWRCSLAGWVNDWKPWKKQGNTVVYFNCYCS